MNLPKYFNIDQRIKTTEEVKNQPKAWMMILGIIL